MIGAFAFAIVNVGVRVTGERRCGCLSECLLLTFRGLLPRLDFLVAL